MPGEVCYVVWWIMAALWWLFGKRITHAEGTVVLAWEFTCWPSCFFFPACENPEKETEKGQKCKLELIQLLFNDSFSNWILDASFGNPCSLAESLKQRCYCAFVCFMWFSSLDDFTFSCEAAWWCWLSCAIFRWRARWTTCSPPTRWTLCSPATSAPPISGAWRKPACAAVSPDLFPSACYLRFQHLSYWSSALLSMCVLSPPPPPHPFVFSSLQDGVP